LLKRPTYTSEEVKDLLSDSVYSLSTSEDEDWAVNVTSVLE
jgi:hypothetical protein